MAPSVAVASHAVHFYEDEGIIGQVVGDSLAEGLLRGETAIAIATPANTIRFIERLSERGVDVDEVSGGGRLLLRDAQETLDQFMVDGRPDPVRTLAVLRALVIEAARTGAPIRIYGEMVQLLWAAGNTGATLELERIWNELGREIPFSLLCGYRLGAAGGIAGRAALRSVSGLHTHLAVAESRLHFLRHDQTPEPLRELTERVARLEAEAVRHVEAERRKDEFLAMLGHELRNPLAPIVTALDLMRMRDDGALRKERAVIERHVQHLTRLVDDLLDVGRLTRGVVDLRKEPTELWVVVTKGIEMAMPLLETRRHHLSVAVPRGLYTDADPVRLSQVVSNLMTNAAKFTNPGGHVWVAARAEDRDVVVEVRDDGIGIPADAMGSLFELFVQGNQPADRMVGGLGIGLALVKNLVKLHGGTVKAQSEGRNRGSTFTVRLPRAAAGLAVVPSPTPPKGIKHRRVMLVDDNRDLADSIADVLRDVGHEIETAPDGPQALVLARRFQPDVVLLDLGLPVMDGYEVGRRLRDQFAGRPVRMIALTGYGQEGDRTRTLAAGFDLHLTKPVDLETLLGAL